MNSLYIVATPIGNLEDISIRALTTLFKTPVIACEDTRHTGNLLHLFRERYAGLISTPFTEKHYISVRDWNEAEVAQKIADELLFNDVALVSDAGTPLLSDPGYKVLQAVIKTGAPIVPIPGPFAGAVAACAAGLPTNKIMFWGFLPKKWDLIPTATNVIYESPLRVSKTLGQIKEKYPQAEIVVARELTKLHEMFVRGDALQSLDAATIKGEVTILVYLPGE